MRLLHTSRLRTQAHTDSQKEQLQRASHEPVCLVPGSGDKYLHVPDCTLQQNLNTLRAFTLLHRYNELRNLLLDA